MEVQLHDAQQTLALLHEQADELRAEVSTLREVQLGLAGADGDRLVHVNEQLVIAALHAHTVAEHAVKDLQTLALSGQHDALTGTPNRALLLDRLETAIAKARRDGSRIALLFLDIDQFKSINDRLGHAAGDEVLKLVARRLESVVREADTVSRHSGDEFVVLLTQVAHPSDAGRVAAKMLRALAIRHDAADQQALFLSASIGIALYPEDGDDAASLMGRADAAMYRSKRKAPGRFEFHGTANDDEDQARHEGVSQDPPAYAVAIARDLHLRNLRDANERLTIAAMIAQESVGQVDATHRRQITFIGTVAHELRNPLTPILQAAELISRPGDSDPRLARLQAVIKRQVAHMVRLIDDLLDGSRISTGKFRLEWHSFDLAAVIATSVETCRPSMTKRLQHFEIGTLPAAIRIAGDGVRMTQVFTNLLDNASKYTQVGGVISLAVERRDDAVLVTVVDNGVGIAGETLPRIFDLFVQEAHALTMHSGGLGIGLAVVRELVEAHGGTVVASSAGRDLGSRFVVTLPIDQAHDVV